jgi:CheY-like chemotaxis protein
MINRKLNILLADDDTDDCVFFKIALDKLATPTHLTTVNDGEQLMELLTKGTNGLPHVLYLDLNMPRKNGFECLTEIKLSKQLQQLPVIIFSTSFEQEVVNLLYKNGAQYFIRKPAEFSQYKDIIQQSLTLIGQNQPAGFCAKEKAGKAENNLQPTRENFVITIKNNGIN